MPDIVYPTSTGWATETVFLNEGEPWDASDPLVKAHPEWFSADPGRSLRGSGRAGAEIEQATAEPGEKRNVAEEETTKRRSSTKTEK